MIQRNAYDLAGMDVPDINAAPAIYRGQLRDLFDTWGYVKGRNRTLSDYYRMHNSMRDLGISIPPQLTRTNAVMGWAYKAVRVMAARSQFDGFVFGGSVSGEMDALVRANHLDTLYGRACTSELVYGVSAMTVMAGDAAKGQPSAKVRSYSANQCCMLWDKDADNIGCGIVLADVDAQGRALRYVAHFPHHVVELMRDSASSPWGSRTWANPHGTPLMVPFIFEPDDDRPLGHSRITPEVQGIIDKAMRDVLRMEVGAEFLTAPQRYILGAPYDLFGANAEPPAPATTGDELADDDATTATTYHATAADMLRAYTGAYLAITRDENGELPQVGQFTPADSENFIRVFENDAQRFSGATNVPLAQLGVLSNNYTSSDALSATNDPLILDVEDMNRHSRQSMWEVGRLMLAVSRGVTVADVAEDVAPMVAHYNDPSMPTFAARADGWTKIGGLDKGIIGTRVWYEGLGLDRATIDRLMAEKDANAASMAYESIFSGGV